MKKRKFVLLLSISICLLTCKKPEEELIQQKKAEAMALQSSGNNDGRGENNEHIFREFTGESPNPFAAENARPSEIPGGGGHDGGGGHELPPFPPNPSDYLSSKVQVTHFSSFGLTVYKTYHLNIMQYLKGKIGANAMYQTEAVYYNNTDGTAYDFRDIPANTSQSFNGDFGIKTLKANTSMNLYARVFYQAQNGFPVNSINARDNYYGASDVITFTANNQESIQNLLYKFKHNPKGHNVPYDSWPYDLLHLPRPGLYDIMLVVSDDYHIIARDLKFMGNPFYEYTQWNNAQLRAHYITKIIHNALQVTVLDEEFENANVVSPPSSVPNGNIFSLAWWPNNKSYPPPNAIGKFAHAIVPNVIFINDNYTQSDYNYYASIPQVSPLRLPFSTAPNLNDGNNYCTLVMFTDNVLVNNLALICRNPAQPKTVPTGFSQTTLKINNVPYSFNVNDQYHRSVGNVTCGRRFQYGTVSARLKVPPLLNASNLPTNITPAFWLYEFNLSQHSQNASDITYNIHCNDGMFHGGKQLSEIDIEFFVSNNPGKVNIVMSIHDYNCGGRSHYFAGNGSTWSVSAPWTNKYGFTLQRSVLTLAPGDQTSAVSIIYEVDKNFIVQYHEYQIVWRPTDVMINIDGTKRAHFTPDDVAIPDRPMQIEMGSGWSSQTINGVQYLLEHTPFPATDMDVVVDWVKIE